MRSLVWSLVFVVACAGSPPAGDDAATEEGSTSTDETTTNDGSSSGSTGDDDPDTGEDSDTGMDDCTPAPQGDSSRVVWEQAVDLAGKENATDVVKNAFGNPVVAVQQEEAVLVAMHDPDGEGVWTWPWESGGDESVNAIAATADGGVVVLGGRDLQTNEHRGWLAKLDVDGVLEWNETIASPVGGASDVGGADVLVRSDGGLLVFGSSAGSWSWVLAVTASGEVGNTVWEVDDDRYHPTQLAEWTGGGLLLTLRDFESGSGHQDSRIIRTDPDGGELWSLLIDEGQHDLSIEALPRAADEFLWLSGFYDGNDDAYQDSFLNASNGAGEPLWAIPMGWCGADGGAALVPGPDAGMIVLQVAWLDVQTASTWDHYIRGFDSEGAELWMDQLPDQGDHVVLWATDASDGVLYVAGATGTNPDRDYYLARIDATPP